MRVVLCDEHTALAESLAHVLAARGAQIVSLLRDPRDVVAVVRDRPVDVCLIGATVTDTDDLAECCAQFAVVLLADELDAAARLRAVQAGVRAIASKRQRLSELLRLLDRVASGERAPDMVAPGDGASYESQHRTEGQRLAAYLSPRERQVLCALVSGRDTVALARSLGMSANTARSHVQSVLTKLGAHSRLAAVRVAVHHSMVDPRTGDWLVPGLQANQRTT
jgi:two-component system, NarL family, nitrate/nitrite response regulator NarL